LSFPGLTTPRTAGFGRERPSHRRPTRTAIACRAIAVSFTSPVQTRRPSCRRNYTFTSTDSGNSSVQRERFVLEDRRHQVRDRDGHHDRNHQGQPDRHRRHARRRHDPDRVRADLATEGGCGGHRHGYRARRLRQTSATGYRGTIHFTSTDTKAALPANYTFHRGLRWDAYVLARRVTLKTKGTRSVTATDTKTATIKGSQTGIVVKLIREGPGQPGLRADPGSLVGAGLQVVELQHRGRGCASAGTVRPGFDDTAVGKRPRSDPPSRPSRSGCETRTVMPPVAWPTGARLRRSVRTRRAPLPRPAADCRLVDGSGYQRQLAHHRPVQGPASAIARRISSCPRRTTSRVESRAPPPGGPMTSQARAADRAPPRRPPHRPRRVGRPRADRFSVCGRRTRSGRKSWKPVANASPPGFQRNPRHVSSVGGDAAGAGLVEAAQQLDQGALAGAVLAHDRHGRTGRETPGSRLRARFDRCPDIGRATSSKRNCRPSKRSGTGWSASLGSRSLRTSRATRSG